MKKWYIQDEKTGKFFSSLGSPHFTANQEIAALFETERDAVLCEEQFIHNDIKFLAYDTIPVEKIN